MTLDDVDKNEDVILNYHHEPYCMIRDKVIIKRFQPIDKRSEKISGLDKLKDESKGIENYES